MSDLRPSATISSAAANDVPPVLLGKFSGQHGSENHFLNGSIWPVNPTVAAPPFEGLFKTKEDKAIHTARIQAMYDKSDEYIKAQHLGKGGKQLVLTVI